MSLFGSILFLQTEPGKKGAGAARNTGMRRALGKWLLFADADDLFLPAWYEVIGPYLESDFDVVCFSPVSRRRDGTESKRHERYARLVRNYLSSSYGGEEQLRGRFSAPWSKLIRTDLVTDHHIRFDEVFYSADVMFSAKVGYYAEKIAAVEEPFYCIVDHDDSMSRTKSDDVFCQRLYIYCERDRFFRERISKKQFAAYGGMSFLYSAKDAVRQGYGWKTIAEMGRVFRKYRIPFITVNFSRHIHKLYKGHGHEAV